MRKALFTVFLGGYDHPPIAPRYAGWDTVVFTDQKVDGWDRVIHVKPTDIPAVESRRYKWLSHLFLPEYDQVCYFDANMKIVWPLPEYPFRIRHFKRRTVREEADACNAQVHRCTVESIENQMAAYTGFTDQVPLYLNGFFSRLHNPIENALHEKVFEIVQKYTPRDQLALPYAMWLSGYAQEKEEDGYFFKKYIRMVPHKKVASIFGELSVHHITPGRSDKNFGKAINSIISKLPDTDWICLRDIDTVPLNHEQFFLQCEEIAKSNKFGLVGCMTNRLGLKHQLHNGEFSENMDMAHHRKIALELTEKHGSEVKPATASIAGLFMLFPKSTWLKVGGFPEGGILLSGKLLDYHFWESVMKKGIKVGVAKGIYLWHSYRLGKDRKNKDHLV